MPLGSFFAAALALNLAPGPDMTYVAARAVAQGTRAGLVSAAGIAVGCLFHIGAAALGIAVLLQAVPQAYAAVRIVGACYLVYLGVGLIRHAASGGSAGPIEAATDRAIFRQGVVTNVLNPKVALFFLAFLPQFTTPRYGPLALQTLLLGFYFNAQGTIVNGLVAWLAGRAGSAVRRVSPARTWLQRVSGGVLVGLGVRLAFSRPQ
jgi:threonine/homoserine/homoserine lactone efflux protein